jgi:acyl carrier protein
MSSVASDPSSSREEAATGTPLPAEGVPEIVARLKQIIAHELDVRIAEHDIDPAVPLLEGGLALDSIVLYELISLVEKRFGFEFSDQHLQTQVFASLNVLAQHIHSEQTRAGAASAR